MSELSVGLRKNGLGFLVDGFDALEGKVLGIQVSPPPAGQVSSPSSQSPGTELAGAASTNPVAQVATNVITDLGDKAKTAAENAINSKFPEGTTFTDEALDAFGSFIEQAAIHFAETAIEHI